MSRACSTFGTSTASGFAAASAAQSSAPHSVCIAVDPDDQLARAKATLGHRRHRRIARRVLRLGRDRVLQVEDHHVAGQRPRLRDRARVGGRQVERAAARTELHAARHGPGRASASSGLQMTQSPSLAAPGPGGPDRLGTRRRDEREQHRYAGIGEQLRHRGRSPPQFGRTGGIVVQIGRDPRA